VPVDSRLTAWANLCPCHHPCRRSETKRIETRFKASLAAVTAVWPRLALIYLAFCRDLIALVVGVSNPWVGTALFIRYISYNNKEVRLRSFY
jgi:hypothetical protein